MKNKIFFLFFSVTICLVSCSDLREPFDYCSLDNKPADKYLKTIDKPKNDIGTKINKTRDGNIIVCGISADSSYPWVAKMTMSGDTLWGLTLTSKGKGGLRDVIETKEGDFIVCGSVSKTISGVIDEDVYVAKISQKGVKDWEQIYGNKIDIGFSIKQTQDGGFVVAGFSIINISTTKQISDMYLLKLNVNGGSEWEKRYGGVGDEGAYSVLQLKDQSIMLSGFTNTKSNGASDAYVLKANSKGDSLWSQRYGDSGEETASTIKVTRDGGFILSGYTTSPFPDAKGKRDAYMLKIENDGRFVWQYPYGDVFDDEGYDIIQTMDDGFAVSGYTERIAGVPNPYFIKVDAQGRNALKIPLGDTKFGRASSLIQTRDCGFMMFGTKIKNTDKDFLIIKTDKDGNYE